MWLHMQWYVFRVKVTYMNTHYGESKDRNKGKHWNNSHGYRKDLNFGFVEFSMNCPAIYSIAPEYSIQIYFIDPQREIKLLQ